MKLIDQKITPRNKIRLRKKRYNKKIMKAKLQTMWVQKHNADFVGILSLMKIIHLFRYANVEEESSSFIMSVSKVGWKLKNIDKLILIARVFIGTNFSVKYAKTVYPTYSLMEIGSILWSSFLKLTQIILSLKALLSKINIPAWFISYTLKKNTITDC